MTLGEKIFELRKKCGLSQEQLGEKINVTRQTISNWENAKSLPDIISIIKLSELYKISVDELIKGDQRIQEKIEKERKIS